MSTLTHPTAIVPGQPVRAPDAARPSRRRYWLAATIAIAGGVAGLALGIDSYRGSQRHIDSFERVAIPGAMALQISEPTGRVLYYEGDDTVRFNDLSITVTDPAGAPVEVNRYVGEMIYETLDLTHGRAVATFNATQTGTYDIDVIGVDTGQLVVGDSFSRRALPGVLTGLAMAGLSVIAGFVLWLLTFIKRASISPASDRGQAGPGL